MPKPSNQETVTVTSRVLDTAVPEGAMSYVVELRFTSANEIVRLNPPIVELAVESDHIFVEVENVA